MPEAIKKNGSIIAVVFSSLVAVFLGVFVIQCGSPEISAGDVECTNSDQCVPGTICSSFLCVEICNQHSDCPDGQRCGPGYCVPADKLVCDAPSDCIITAESHPECFSAECIGQECVYTPQVGTTCEPAGCTNGIAFEPLTCDEFGQCDLGGRATSCQGYACADDAVSCGDTCEASDDCVDGYTCETTINSCITDLRAAGEACVEAGAPTERCVPTASCVSGVCETLDGQACTSNTACLSDICILGTCAQGVSGLGESCDDIDDCDANLLCSENLCRKLVGDSCTANADCDGGNCECNDGACQTRSCAAVDCVCGYGTAGDCEYPMNGVNDPQDCDTALETCVAGECQ